MSIYKLYKYTLITFLFFSCEKEVTVDLPTPDPKIVVEGQIEENQPPFVILTRNSAYFSSYDIDALNNNLLHGAMVQVSDGIDTVTLTEYCCATLPIAIRNMLLQQMGIADTNCIYDFCIYTSYPDLSFIGTVGKTYYLSADYYGEKVNAVSNMYASVAMDSVWVEYNIDTDNDSLVRLMTRFSEPATIGDFYKYFTNRNQEPYYYGAVFDDKFVNGITFDSPIFRAVPRGTEFDEDEFGLFRKGDTIRLKWCTIDFAAYNFYNTMDFELNGQGSPFASPTIIQSNIQGGLGIWSAYSAAYHELIVP